MSPTIKIDMSQWRKAANELFATSKRSLPDFINGQALAVSLRALKLTKKASRSEIESTLGQVGRKETKITRGKNAGKTRQGARIVRDDSLAARILLATFKRTGKWLADGRDIEERASKLIAKRVAGIGYIKAGWIPAIQKLRSVVKRKPKKAGGSIGGIRQIGRPKGRALPSRFQPGILFAQIENDVPGLAPTTSGFALAGLQDALRESSRDMIDTLAKRLKRDMAKNGMK